MKDLITEGKVKIEDLTFTVHTIVDRKGLGINFIPDCKTLDLVYKNGTN